MIALAAVYQLTPLKDACLRSAAARSPSSSALAATAARRAADGREHGAWCVGCCWALMAALFALGLMSLAWMALVAA